MHVHAGFVVKIAEEVGFQADCRSTVTGGDRDDVLFWLTDLGWIMGPWQIFGTLAWGATMFCYDGAPDYPGPDRLWAMVERHRISILGISPTLVRALMAHGDEPVRAHDLSSLRVLGSTGEPWNEGPWWWYFDVVGGGRCPVINVSGGTEVGCFLAPHVVEPIAPCSLGGPALGCAVDVVDDDCQPVRGVGGRADLPAAVAGDDAGDVEGARPLPRDLLVALAGRLVARRLGIDRRRRPLVPARPLRRHDQARGEAARSRRGGDRACRASGSGRGCGDRHCPTSSRARRSWATWSWRPAPWSTTRCAPNSGGRVGDALGKSFTPSAIHFTAALPKTRSNKVMRRAIRAVALGQAAR